MASEKLTATAMEPIEGSAGKPRRLEAAYPSTAPTMMPITPPMRQMIMASTTNCTRMALLGAPRALRVPISRVRSVTETSMMFITPMPPTTSEMPAMTAMAMETVSSMLLIWETMVSMLMV